MTVCQPFSAALTAKGMTSQQLANVTGSDATRMSQICAGTATPTSDEYNKIASALGMSTPPAGHPR
ncbi:hypothetical protein K503DRAFT_799747 [Rhizopogon vinicolor AM-OR11-026]|uniref:HTH cro/C1-type domain-containing protein n=1 Tax=Rhizopogon vinicolor AM-OR11-026 TaxID=1314800 RepID=A0A1B7N384_9AGAM|nr:hypothetical protein K503DRAFT_799747 [Rhizopogon vinicolor AM-OR11-026]